jgi:hypothetical protein
LLKVKKAPFVPIPLTDNSDKVVIDVIASLAASLGSAKLDPVDVAAAFKLSGSESFRIQLSGSCRCDLRETELERALADAKLSAFGKRCRGADERFFVVTRTVLATKARISGDTDLTATTQALSKLPAVLTGKIRADMSRKSKSTIEMEPVGQEMVIGFRALEIIDGDAGMVLKGLDQPLKFRDEQMGTPATAGDFSAEGSAFIELVSAPKIDLK